MTRSSNLETIDGPDANGVPLKKMPNHSNSSYLAQPGPRGAVPAGTFGISG